MTSAKRKLPFDHMFGYLLSRETDSNVKLEESTREAYSARHLPTVLRERETKIGELDKIFSSAWLDCNNVICGTKCNTVSHPLATFKLILRYCG